jgi:FKBP-type peptidyl-prolyl cis-trans isomerase SlyD
LNAENHYNVVVDNVVVTLEYELKVDGEVIDSSENGDPIVFLQGANQIVVGLEQGIYGMKLDESREIVVAPEDGYGEYDENGIVEVDRKEFPSDFPLEPGVEITVHADDEGEEDIMEATIVSVDKSTVTLNFNHPLAGKTLNFKVTVIDIREATEEEIEHGHVHGDDDDEFEFEDEDFDETSEE